MADISPLSDVAALVRRHDPDRFLCALFAPAAQRESVFTLLALNHELARAREVASQPMTALIRLQWWRDVVEEAAAGKPARRHEVAAPVAALVRGGVVAPEDLLRLVDAREAEAAGSPKDRRAFVERLRGTAGGLAALTGRVLGTPDRFLPALEAVGTAYGVAGVLRSLPAYAAGGRNPLPADEVAAAGGGTEAAVDPRTSATRAIARGLATDATALLAEGTAGVRGLPREAFAAALPGALARRDLRRILREGWVATESAPRGIGDRLAVLRAFAMKRI